MNCVELWLVSGSDRGITEKKKQDLGDIEPDIKGEREELETNHLLEMNLLTHVSITRLFAPNCSTKLYPILTLGITRCLSCCRSVCCPLSSLLPTAAVSGPCYVQLVDHDKWTVLQS